ALDGKVHGNAQIDAMLRVWTLMRHLTRWLLNDPSGKLDMAQAVQRYGAGMKELRGIVGEVMAEGDRALTKADRDNWVKAGFPQDPAEMLSWLPALTSALDIIDVARAKHLPVRQVAEVYYALGEALHLKWLMLRIEELPVDGRWHAHARGTLRDEL